MKRVLVTGGSGFIGSHTLAPLLERGYEVHATRWRTECTEPVAWHQTNLLDETSVRDLLDRIRPSHLLHAAWFLEPGKYSSSLENFRWVRAGLDLLRAFQESGGERIVMVGTCFEYDWSSPVLSERTTPLAPRTVYGACKKALFELTELFATTAELEAAWARPFYMYGPREDPRRLVADVIRSLLAGREARCSEGRQFRDYQYVGDVAAALVALLDSVVTGPVNIGTGRAVAVRDIVLAIADRLQARELVNLGAIPTAPDDPPMLEADIRRLSEEVGWHGATTLEEGLALTINWWKHQPEQWES